MTDAMSYLRKISIIIRKGGAKMLTKMQSIIQGTYIFLFIYSSLVVVGCVESGISILPFWKIVYVVSTFLTLGKIIYCKINGDI